jgi:hypothetical protein
MGSDEFFGLVDELLSPSMAALGYHRIGGTGNDQPQSRGTLAPATVPSRSDGSTGKAPFLLYDFGFEAGGDTAQRLVDPKHPDNAEELWLSYEPATGELDLSAWGSLAEGRADWDPRSDTGPCSASEVRHRLATMGRAAADLARSHGDPKNTS